MASTHIVSAMTQGRAQPPHGSRSPQWSRRWARGLVALALSATTAGVWAIDNPAAPDRVGAFEARAAPFEARLAATDGGGAAVQAGAAYARFLDAELDTACRTLRDRLDAPARTALVRSRQQWLRFRDAQRRFITLQWTRERNGTSAILSVAEYSNAIVRRRVIQLLRYAAEYP